MPPAGIFPVMFLLLCYAGSAVFLSKPYVLTIYRSIHITLYSCKETWWVLILLVNYHELKIYDRVMIGIKGESAKSAYLSYGHLVALTCLDEITCCSAFSIPKIITRSGQSQYYKKFYCESDGGNDYYRYGL